ncbi:DUF4306 domain-containing protein [Rummeliibacillus sp. NPDC094406]|uniref:DUF4306 domain-containing protein n=1 Tax=Rummeliibacillus sp. NPDC094406 TaxID=3364511 RepID=UPI00381C7714
MVFAFLMFFGSSLIAFYEGSGIVDNPWEWAYSTPFSHFIGGGVQQASDISIFDYFVYAAKFHPAYPLMMMLSIIYLFILLGVILSKRKKSITPLYFGLFSFIMLALAFVLLNASTLGGKVFSYLFLAVGIALLVFSLIVKKKLVEQI